MHSARDSQQVMNYCSFNPGVKRYSSSLELLNNPTEYEKLNIPPWKV